MSSATAQIKRSTLVNGLNVAALFEVIDAVKSNSEIAKFNFRLTNKWLGGEKTRSIVKEFTGALQNHRADAKGFVVDTGEPPVLLGEDTAPNPGEWLLHSLVSCLTTTIVYHAAARGIAIDGIESEIDGDVDLRGFLGLASDVRKGYSAVRVRMRVKTNAERVTIENLATYSPMLEVVSGSVPVSLKIETY
jgi:uncharacterized OsmC-like protein